MRSKKWIDAFLIRWGLTMQKGPQESIATRNRWQKRIAQLNEACDRLNSGLLAVAFVLAWTVAAVGTFRAMNLILDTSDSAAEGTMAGDL